MASWVMGNVLLRSKTNEATHRIIQRSLLGWKYFKLFRIAPNCSQPMMVRWANALFVRYMLDGVGPFRRPSLSIPRTCNPVQKATVGVWPVGGVDLELMGHVHLDTSELAIVGQPSTNRPRWTASSAPRLVSPRRSFDQSESRNVPEVPEACG